MSLRDTPKHENGCREPERAELKTKPEWQFSEQGDERLTECVILSPMRFAHSSTSLTVPERSRREGRLFACHSDPAAAGEESLSFHTQGKLREAPLVGIENNGEGFFASLSRSCCVTTPRNHENGFELCGSWPAEGRSRSFLELRARRSVWPRNRS